MTFPHVVTARDFHAFLPTLLDTAGQYAGSLEAWLRALLAEVEAAQDEPPTYALFARMFHDSFHRVPPPFERAWLAVVTPPASPSWLAYQAARGTPVAEDPPLTPYARLRHTLVFLIADLHRMAAAGVFARSGQELWWGVDSPTGHRWYALLPATYLHAMIYEAAPETTAGDWDVLVEPLQTARTYEA